MPVVATDVDDGFMSLTLLALSVGTVYYVIRTAVHHGIRDAERTREADKSKS